MRTSFGRKAVAYSIIASIWFSSLTLLPVDTFGQETQPAPSKDTKTDKKKDKKEAKPSATPAGPTPLSPKDDPNQIGKRKIYRIKILTPGGQVRVIEIKADQK